MENLKDALAKLKERTRTWWMTHPHMGDWVVYTYKPIHESHGMVEIIQVTDAPVERLVKALELALYYVEGDATYEALCEKIARILAGEG